MFDALSTRLQDVFQSLSNEVRLTPETTERVLREIRVALIEADVNLQVVKAFVDRVRDQASDAAVQASLSPSQHVVKIVRDELLGLFGDAKGGLSLGGPDERGRAASEVGRPGCERDGGSAGHPAEHEADGLPVQRQQ